MHDTPPPIASKHNGDDEDNLVSATELSNKQVGAAGECGKSYSFIA